MNEYVQTIELSKGNERTKAYAITDITTGSKIT